MDCEELVNLPISTLYAIVFTIAFALHDLTKGLRPCARSNLTDIFHHVQDHNHQINLEAHGIGENKFLVACRLIKRIIAHSKTGSVATTSGKLHGAANMWQITACLSHKLRVLGRH